MLRIILVLCRTASIVFALLSVYYWFRGSNVTVTDADRRYDPKVDFIINDPEHKTDNINFLATAKEQMKFNRVAAIYTALAVLSEAAVTLFL